MMIYVYLVLILSTCHTRVVLQDSIHVCNFFFNDNVYKMILHVCSSWVCDLLDIMKINLSKLVKLVKLVKLMNDNLHIIYLFYIHTLLSSDVLREATTNYSSTEAIARVLYIKLV